MNAYSQRKKIMTLLVAAVKAGGGPARACTLIWLSGRTLQRWKNDAANGVRGGRPQRVQMPKNRLSNKERKRLP